MSMEERVNKYLSKLGTRLNIIIDGVDSSKYFDYEKANMYMNRMMILVYFMCYYVLIIAIILLVMPNTTLVATEPDTIAVYMAKQLSLYSIPVFFYCLIQLLFVAGVIVIGLYKYKPDVTEE